ncbi:MAG: HAMP domain-containing sensor histidine kinase [Bacteroidota bacterium]|nr:HAMP domain-containing sensor histidine kinase [Bacteroidota bacterium]
MTQWLKLTFIAVYILLTAIQLKLFYSIYKFEEKKLYNEIELTIKELKNKIETYEINRHKNIFDHYKKENLCGDTYQNKPLELTFVIAPTDSFSNLKELNDIIYNKLSRQAINSAKYLIEKLPLDSAYLDSLVKNTFNSLNPKISGNYNLYATESPEYNSALFKVKLFDDYRLYYPLFLVFDIRGISDVLFRNILLITLGSLLAMILLFIATRYSYLSIARYKSISENKAEFINHLTHEIKTPLTSIYLASQALTDKRISKSPASVKLYSQLIFNEAERLNKQLESVLSVSAAEKNFLQLNIEKSNVHELIEKVAELFRQKIRDYNGIIELNLKASEFEGLIDQIHIGNVLYNLFDNAVKYSEQDKIYIHVETSNEGNELVLKIKDQGKGINSAELEKIFNLFYKNEKNVSGFGVGLHYAKKIIEFHHGTITVESKIHIGTTFTIKIPLFK